MRAPRVRWFLLLTLAVPASGQVQRVQPGDADQTLRAMRDELERSRERLRMGELQPPYYIEYRLVDVDARSVTASFGALVQSTTTRNRFMTVDVRVGDYQLDSSHFIADDAFRGFIGSTGTVGIDRDYESLRQDLWLATDQAYKEALDRLSRKQGYLRSLARAPNVPDFSREQPVVLVAPRFEPDWTSRDWEAEARSASQILRQFPELHDTRVSYHLVFLTYHLMNSEGTQVRVSRTAAAIEAGSHTQAENGMRLHHIYSRVARTPAELPSVAVVRGELERSARELLALRSAPPAEDYVGPVLFEPHAAASLLAQLLGPSVSGARPPVAMLPFFEQMLQQSGARSEWLGRLGTRVLPAGVTLVDDPRANEFEGQPLLGGYEVDEEGVRAQRVTLVESGILRNLLMSRRPGPDFQQSNGHGRAALLSAPRPAMSNLFFQSSDAVPPDELRRQFLDLCRAEGRSWCLVVRQMDNPLLGSLDQEDSFELFSSLAAGIGSGDRQPLLVYRVFVDGGQEELIRGARLTGLTLRSLRNLAGVGNDQTVFHFFQNPSPEFAGTAFGAFGTAQGGLPTSVVAPSLLLEEVEVRGARGEPRRPPVLPAPPLN